jgi:cytidine deaminase
MESKKIFSFEYEIAQSSDAAHKQLFKLIEAAEQAMTAAYAPYSKFRVGAAVLLDNGEVVTGNNQENAAYPSGLCAERVAVFYASSQHPDSKIVSVAISSSGSIEKLVAPCGSCRQALLEYENKQGSDIKIVLRYEHEKAIIIPSVKSLLPFSFGPDCL